jgi:hypothetical protein
MIHPRISADPCIPATVVYIIATQTTKVVRIYVNTYARSTLLIINVNKDVEPATVVCKVA